MGIKIRASAIQQSRYCHSYHTLETADTDDTRAGTSDHDLTARLLQGLTVPQPDDDPEFMRFWSWWDALGFGSPTEVEPEWSMEIGGHTVTGHPDVVWEDDTSIYIPDYKFGEQRFLAPTADNAQVIAYGVMAGERCGWSKQIVADLVKCNHQERDPAPITEDYRDWLIGVLDDIAKGGFNPRPACSRCLARTNCDAYLDGAHQLVPMDSLSGEVTAERMQALAMALGPAKTLLSKAEDAVKAYVRAGGVIEDDEGRRYLPKEVETERVKDHKACLTAIEKNGFCALDHAKISKRMVIESLQYDVEVLEQLRESGALVTTTSERWGWR